MNTKIIYAAGVVIIVIGIIFYLSNLGFFSFPNSANLNNGETNVGSDQSSVTKSKQAIANSGDTLNKGNTDLKSSQQTQINSNRQNLSLSVKSLDIVPIDNGSQLQIAFNVYNPNRGSALLEGLSYNVYYDNVRLASGDIGSKPEGFVDSLESVFSIIGNQTITLKDKKPLSSQGNDLFDSNGRLILLSNNSSLSKLPNVYVVNGTFSTTLARGTSSDYNENIFSLNVPFK